MAGYFDNARRTLDLIVSEDMSEQDLRLKQVAQKDYFYSTGSDSSKGDGNGGYILALACGRALSKEDYNAYVNRASDEGSQKLLAPHARQIHVEIDNLEKLVLGGWKQGVKTYTQEPDYDKSDIIGYDTDEKPRTEHRYYEKSVVSETDQEALRNITARYMEEAGKMSAFSRSCIYNDDKDGKIPNTLLIKEDDYALIMARENRQPQVGK